MQFRQLSVNHHSFNPHKLVKQTYKAFEQQARVKGITYDYEVQQSIPK